MTIDPSYIFLSRNDWIDVLCCSFKSFSFTVCPLLRDMYYYSLDIDIVTCRGYAWLIITGSGFDLLAFLLQLHLITIDYSSSQSMTVSFHSLLDYECLVFHCDWIGSDLRIGHFFSFRCPLVNTPQLNTQLVISLLWMTWTTNILRLLNELSFITRGEQTRDHHNQQFVYWSVPSVATGIRVSQSLTSSRLFRLSGVMALVITETCLANRVLACRCPAMVVHSDFTIPTFSCHVTIWC
jgi:hypothetical protein